MGMTRDRKQTFLSLRPGRGNAETHFGPDGTRLKQNAQARLKSLYMHAGRLASIGLWKCKERMLLLMSDYWLGVQ